MTEQLELYRCDECGRLVAYKPASAIVYEPIVGLDGGVKWRPAEKALCEWCLALARDGAATRITWEKCGV